MRTAPKTSLRSTEKWLNWPVRNCENLLFSNSSPSSSMTT
eukprot:IDg17422t1